MISSQGLLPCSPQSCPATPQTSLMHFSYFFLSLQADTLLLRVEVSGFTVNYYVCTFQSNMSAYSHTLLGKERWFLFFPPIHTPKWLACLFFFCLSTCRILSQVGIKLSDRCPGLPVSFPHVFYVIYFFASSERQLAY